ncbi:MAG: hypothetical protein Q8Q96_01490 [bacterium]|nr:hypothetical protein [bacterium]
MSSSSEIFRLSPVAQGLYNNFSRLAQGWREEGRLVPTPDLFLKGNAEIAVTLSPDELWELRGSLGAKSPLQGQEREVAARELHRGIKQIAERRLSVKT